MIAPPNSAPTIPLFDSASLAPTSSMSGAESPNTASGSSGSSGNPSGSATTPTSTFAADNSLFAANWKSDEELRVGTSNIQSGNIVAGHIYEVIGYTAETGVATDMLTLRNPWGSAYLGPLATTFTISLAADDVTIFATAGKPTV